MAIEYGLVDEPTRQRYEAVKAAQTDLLKSLRETILYPNEMTQKKLSDRGWAVLQKPYSCEELLRRVEVSCSDLFDFGVSVSDELLEVVEPVEVAVKYSGYISRQLELITQSAKLENLRLPTDIDYSAIKGLSREEVEKLSSIKPETLGQASRISGVNPSAVQAIMLYLRGRDRRAASGVIDGRKEGARTTTSLLET